LVGAGRTTFLSNLRHPSRCDSSPAHCPVRMCLNCHLLSPFVLFVNCLLFVCSKCPWPRALVAALAAQPAAQRGQSTSRHSTTTDRRRRCEQLKKVGGRMTIAGGRRRKGGRGDASLSSRRLSVGEEGSASLRMRPVAAGGGAEGRREPSCARRPPQRRAAIAAIHSMRRMFNALSSSLPLVRAASAFPIHPSASLSLGG